MESWFVRPDTRLLQLSDGQWLKVKDRLSAGEFRAHLRRSTSLEHEVATDADGNTTTTTTRRVDPLLQNLSTVVAYLLDWSLEAPIERCAESELIAALDALDIDRYSEIRDAVNAHQIAMDRERELAKNGKGGEKKSSAISPSPAAVAGALSGSAS